MIPVSQAVSMLYHGRSNVIKAADACGESPETLKNCYLRGYKRTLPLNHSNSPCFSNVLELKWDHFVNEETQEVWVHIPGGYPTTIALPHVIRREFPGYTGHICTKEFLQSLKDQ